MITVQDYQVLIKRVLESKHFSDLMHETLNLILNGKLTFYFFDEFLKSKNLTLKDVKAETLDVILDYAEMILDDDNLSEDEILSIRTLRAFLGVEEGDFQQFKRMDRVEAIIIEQLQKLYADNKIDQKEMLHKSELQGLFGLSYNEYQDIVNKVAIEAYSRGADVRDLDTYL